MYFIITLLIHSLDQPKFYQELPGKLCPSPNPMNSNDISSDSVNTAWKKDLQFSVRPQLSSFYSAYLLDRGEILQLCLRECLQTEPLVQHAWIEIFSFLTPNLDCDTNSLTQQLQLVASSDFSLALRLYTISATWPHGSTPTSSNKNSSPNTSYGQLNIKSSSNTSSNATFTATNLNNQIPTTPTDPLLPTTQPNTEYARLKSWQFPRRRILLTSTLPMCLRTSKCSALQTNEELCTCLVE